VKNRYNYIVRLHNFNSAIILFDSVQYFFLYMLFLTLNIKILEHMRYAIISDIHGNLEALKTALDHIKELDVPDIVCLGDVVGYGPNPNECIELVRVNCTVTVKGNHDAAAVDLMHTVHMNRLAREAAIWTNERLNPSAKDFLNSLPLQSTIKNATLVHASPQEPDEWHYIMTNFDAEIAFNHFDTPVCFIGHSHRPGEFTKNSQKNVTGKKRIINVGSIGQPRDRDPKLSFGLFDPESLSYENIRLSYDVETTADKMYTAGLPSELAERLFYGL